MARNRKLCLTLTVPVVRRKFAVVLRCRGSPAVRSCVPALRSGRGPGGGGCVGRGSERVRWRRLCGWARSRGTSSTMPSAEARRLVRGQPAEDGAAKYVERDLEIKPATEIPAPYTLQDGTRAARRPARNSRGPCSPVPGYARPLEHRRHQPGRERAAAVRPPVISAIRPARVDPVSGIVISLTRVATASLTSSSLDP